MLAVASCFVGGSEQCGEMSSRLSGRAPWLPRGGYRRYTFEPELDQLPLLPAGSLAQAASHSAVPYSDSRYAGDSTAIVRAARVYETKKSHPAGWPSLIPCTTAPTSPAKSRREAPSQYSYCKLAYLLTCGRQVALDPRIYGLSGSRS
jgi:hypothetical protein